MLHIPEGCAHGFLTLEDNSAVQYLVSAFYSPTSEAGLRYDDPAFNIKWPIEPSVVSAKDLAHPPFSAGVLN
jgi:dTDP-4-dehydrorhamnose 3,5-epimerase